MDHTQAETNKANRAVEVHLFGSALDALSNLIYLASHEAEHPDRVRFYLKLAEARIKSMGTERSPPTG